MVKAKKVSEEKSAKIVFVLVGVLVGISVTALAVSGYLFWETRQMQAEIEAQKNAFILPAPDTPYRKASIQTKPLNGPAKPLKEMENLAIETSPAVEEFAAKLGTLFGDFATEIAPMEEMLKSLMETMRQSIERSTEAFEENLNKELENMPLPQSSGQTSV